MSQKAYDEGCNRTQFRGRLRKYLDKKFFRFDAKGRIFKIHGEVLFIFGNGRLVTVWVIPSEYRKSLNQQIRRIKDAKRKLISENT